MYSFSLKQIQMIESNYIPYEKSTYCGVNTTGNLILDRIVLMWPENKPNKKPNYIIIVVVKN